MYIKACDPSSIPIMPATCWLVENWIWLLSKFISESFIVISETWFGTDAFFGNHVLENYDLFCSSRPQSGGGGITVYVNVEFESRVQTTWLQLGVTACTYQKGHAGHVHSTSCPPLSHRFGWQILGRPCPVPLPSMLTPLLLAIFTLIWTPKMNWNFSGKLWYFK